MNPDNEWLKQLNEDIWQEHNGYYAGHPTKHYSVKRKVTDEEWKQIKRIAKDRIVEPHNAGMGFNFGITIYEAPTYIGLPCEPLITIEGGHFDERFDAAWKRMSPLSHNKSNEGYLKLFKFEPLHDVSHYDY